MSLPKRSANGRAEILIAPAGPAQAEHLRQLLERRGHIVTVAGNGKEALEAARTRKPTLIVTDIAMPDMDGYALCKGLKTEKELKDVPVILLTSLSGTEDLLKGLDCGADMFIRKPYDEAWFLSRIDDALSNQRLGKHAKKDESLQIKLGDNIHHISAKPQHILDWLVSTYEDATRINAELGKKQLELTRLAAGLEKDVEERTAALRAEVAEHKRASEQLHQSEEQFRVITESISDLIAVLDLEGKRLYNSPSYKEVLGDPIALRGTDSFNEIHPDDREKIRKIFQVTVRTGRGQRAEYRFLLRDGSIRYIESQGSAIPDTVGKSAKVVVVSRDITERKRVEEALRQSETELRAALLAAQMGVWDWAVATDTVTWDENLYRIAGRDPKLPAPSYEEHPRIYTAESWERLKAAVEHALATGTPYELDLELLRPDGSKRWVIGRGRPLRDASGRITQLRGTVQDITERKRTAEALSESERRYRDFIEHANEGVWRVELEQPIPIDLPTEEVVRRLLQHGYLAECNDAHARAMGFSIAKELIGRHLVELLPASDEERMETFRAAARDGFQGRAVEFRIRDKTGDFKHLLRSEVPIVQDGRLVRIWGITRDITELRQAEGAMQESEEKYRSLVSNIPDVSWTLDDKSRFVFISSNIERVSGYSPDEVYQQGAHLYLSSLHPDDVSKVTEGFRALFAEGRPFDVEIRVKRKDGEWRWVHHRALATYEKNGIRYADGLLSDITERKQAEQALRESEERFRRLFEVGSDAILLVEVDTGRVLDVNAAALKLYGYSRDEFLFLTAGEVFAEPEKTRTSIGDERAQAQLRWHRKKDGTVFPVELTGNSFVNQGRRIYVAVIRDITERLRAEVEHTRLVTAIEQSAEAVVISNTNGDIEYVNPAFTRISGYSREEVLGRNPRMLKSDKHDAAFYRQLWEKILKGEIWRGEIVNRRKDGSFYTEEMNIAPVRDALGKITHFIATKQDVTEHKALEERLRQAAKMEAIGRLAGGIAHDFNNLLTIINGYSELGLDGLNSDDPMRRYLNEIMKAGDRAASLTRQLLAFSRQQVLAPQILDLNDVVANVGEMLHRLIGEDIHLVMVPDRALGRVKADAGQIEQILMNLGANARDAMPNGGKLVIETANVEFDTPYARSHTAVAPGRYVMLAVSDTGIGMDAETQAHIFEPFFTTKEKGKGTGLGLATVYGIVKQSGGYVWVYSEPARGSAFKIYLPRVEEAGGSVQFPEAAGHPGAASETILLVEDEEAVRALAARILQRLGYKVLESTSPEDALQISDRHTETIHLLLTDVVLPSMSGRKVAEILAPLRPGMKALYMSGYTDDSIVRNGVLEATAAFLQKPFTPATLARKVREVLDAGREQNP